MKRTLSATIAVVLAATVAACGGDDDSAGPVATLPPATTSAPTAVPVTAAPTTAAPTTVAVTVAPTTAAPATTEPATTVPATTTPVLSGWAYTQFSVDAGEEAGGIWGDPSPAAPTTGGAPTDGYYDAELNAPWQPGDTSLSVTVRRYDLCSNLPVGTCFEGYEPDELGLDPAWALDLDVPLDASTSVVVGGGRCYDDSPTEVKAATGTELRDLFDAYDADYQQAVAPRLADGQNEFDIMDDLAANPVGGFVGEEAVCGEQIYLGRLRYEYDDAPMLVVQVLTQVQMEGPNLPMGPTDLVILEGVRYTGGVPIFWFYGGFRS